MQADDVPTVDDGGDDPFAGLGPDDDDALDEGDLARLAAVKAAVLETTTPPVRLGRFEVVGVLGRGAVGQVYEAHDPTLDRTVALKVHVDASPTPEQRERMLREARALAKLVHDNVVHVYEVIQDDPRVYVVMERLRGPTLRAVQDRDRPGWDRLIELYAMAGRGLQAAHDQGIVHRDFKPDNVIVDEQGRARVVDFGLARGAGLGTEEAAQTDDAGARLEESGAVERVAIDPLTATGTVLGTPAYMAPEQLAGRPATPRSDQFAFCVALHEALHGRRPFTGATIAALLHSMDEGLRRPAPSDQHAPTWPWPVIERGLSLDPRRRFPSMQALLTELERSRRRRVQWSRVRWAAGGLAVAGLVSGAIAAAHSGAAGGLVTVGTGLTATLGSAPDRACVDAGLEVRDGWSRVRAQAAHAQELAELGGVLDGAIARFAAGTVAACRQASPRAAACIASGRRALDEQLARAQVHPLAATSFSSLAEGLALCLEDLPAGTCDAPGDDGGARERLTAARSERDLGRPSAALALADQAWAIAHAGGDRLGKADASLLRGQLYDQQEQVQQAREALDEALALAVACRAPVPTIDAALARVEVELHHVTTGQGALATLPLEVARGVLDEQGSGSLSLRRALYDEKRGGVELYLERRCGPALALFRSALTRREAIVADLRAAGQPVGWARQASSDAELNLANAELDCDADGSSEREVLERLRDARAHLEEGLAGADHPSLAAHDFAHGRALARYGRHAEAEASLRAAIERYERLVTPDRPSTDAAYVRLALVEVLRRSKRLDQAQAEAEAYLAWLRAHPAAASALTLAEALGALGSVAASQRAYERARAYHREAIELLLREAGTGPLEGRERVQLATCYGNEALALCGLDRGDEATGSLAEGERWQAEPSQLASIRATLERRGCVPPATPSPPSPSAPR